MNEPKPFHFPGIAFGFYLFGTLATIALGGLLWFSNQFTGWGDGAGGSSAQIPIVVVVLPYSLYFVCGGLAANSFKIKFRKTAAIWAHLIPLVSLIFFRRQYAMFFIVLYIITFGLFGFPWYFMLKKYPDNDSI